MSNGTLFLVHLSQIQYDIPMPRNTSFESLILSTRPQGENNRSVCAFSADDGIFYATLYGGPKSKLRALVSPFNRGRMWLYRDEVKRTSKIIDFDVQNFHPSFRENLYKSWAASLAAEVLLRTKCAGSTQLCWPLLNGFLDGMELSGENESRIGTIRFIWRYLAILGVRPDALRCAQCGKTFSSGNFDCDDVSYKAAYDETDNGFVCADCSDIKEKRFVLGIRALTYLEAVADLDAKTVRSLTVDGRAMNEMKQLCFFLLENACSAPLKSLESGIGIL